MTKREIVVTISKETKLIQKDVARIVQATFDHLSDELAKGHKIELRNFGVFECKVRKSRKGRNPKQPKNEVVIPERVVVKFRAGRELKERVDKLKPSKIK
jgi:nucleoid DNA-binding protein